MTRRSVNTRLVPNNIAEQEEEKSRRFLSIYLINSSINKKYFYLDFLQCYLKIQIVGNHKQIQ